MGGVVDGLKKGVESVVDGAKGTVENLSKGKFSEALQSATQGAAGVASLAGSVAPFFPPAAGIAAGATMASQLFNTGAQLASGGNIFSALNAGLPMLAQFVPGGAGVANLLGSVSNAAINVANGGNPLQAALSLAPNLPAEAQGLLSFAPKVMDFIQQPSPEAAFKSLAGGAAQELMALVPQPMQGLVSQIGQLVSEGNSPQVQQAALSLLQQIGGDVAGQLIDDNPLKFAQNFTGAGMLGRLGEGLLGGEIPGISKGFDLNAFGGGMTPGFNPAAALGGLTNLLGHTN